MPTTNYSSIASAQRLNAGCHCTTVDQAGLTAELERVSPGFHAEVIATRPYLFSESMVFVGGEHVAQMAAVIKAVEVVVVHPAYQQMALQWAPEIARHVPATRGVFFGYDFHLHTGEAASPQLIEINTNAGGALLNAVLARAQQACCAEVQTAIDALLPGALGRQTPEQLFLEMFRAEWELFCAHKVAPSPQPSPARGEGASACAMSPVGAGDTPSIAQSTTPSPPAAAGWGEGESPSTTRLATIAIVDDSPTEQFLHPEFVLFQRLFQHAGIDAIICDPSELTWHDGALWHGDKRINLVYNRLTDFALAQPQNSAIRSAYLADAIALTPHPRAHALYADKRNLSLLTDAKLLASFGIDAATIAILQSGIPHTEIVHTEHADELWAGRKHLFFKPATGYGSKAAYRGDKITRRVFDEVIHGNYVAQALVPPSSRSLQRDGEAIDLKLDLRCYTYDSSIQLIAARLWQGQTTNFRTPGGGFATVLTLPTSLRSAPAGLPISAPVINCAV